GPRDLPRDRGAGADRARARERHGLPLGAEGRTPGPRVRRARFPCRRLQELRPLVDVPAEDRPRPARDRPRDAHGPRMTTLPLDAKDVFPEVPLVALDTLWFQVAGTLCNLECTHCFISSSPTNRSHAMMGLATVRRYLAEAAELGVKEYYFTGGE